MRKIALFLVVGILINVLVAWTLSVVVPVGRSQEHGYVASSGVFWNAFRYRSLGVCGLNSERFLTGRDIEDRRGKAPRILLEARAELLRPTADFEKPGYTREVRVQEGRGFPCISLWFERRCGVSGKDVPLIARQNRGGVTVPLGQFANMEERVIPLIPDVRGTAINTLCYAALFGIGFLLWRATRHAYRRKQGKCIKCGYLVRNSAICSECGYPVER